MTGSGFAVRGPVFHAPRRGRVDHRADGVITLDRHGRIQSVQDARSDDGADLIKRHRGEATLHELRAGQYLLPGLVDLHVHAPQWPQLGKALDVPLEQWLLKHTFPLEARYADLAFARRCYTSLVDALLANGTTTAVYFATIHRDSALELAAICRAKGQRAVVGRVAMDDPTQCPDDYRDADAAASIAETRAFIDATRELDAGNGLVLPAVTPRFIPTCTDAALAGLGALAREHGCHVQTHCSESDWEHGYVLARTGMRDSQALEHFGLLTRRSVLAHGTLMDDDDFARLARTGAAIAHCPLSNMYFGDAVLRLRRALDRGVHVGLGTDIAGGPSASIFESCRAAIAASRVLESGVDPSLGRETRRRVGERIDFREAFWLATAGGGEALDLPIGRFAPGLSFDAIVVDAHAPGSDLRLWPDLDAPEDVLQKIINAATRANVARVFVQGRVVVGA